RSVVAALDDGRVITGLPVEETADRLVLKTAAGERVTIATRSIEDRRISDVSLLPGGLAQALNDRQLGDPLADLGTPRQPVSILGQCHAIGPLDEPGATPRIDPSASVDLETPVDAGRGRRLTWRRVDANTEGLVDLTGLASGQSGRAAAAYLYTPV